MKHYAVNFIMKKSIYVDAENEAEAKRYALDQGWKELSAASVEIESIQEYDHLEG